MIIKSNRLNYINETAIEECTKKRLMKGTKEGLSKIHDFTLEMITDSGLHKLKVEQ